MDDDNNHGYDLVCRSQHFTIAPSHRDGWQNTIRKRRHDGCWPHDIEEELVEIEQAMLHDKKFMGDNAESVKMRRSVFQEMAKSMSFKKELWKRLNKTFCLKSCEQRKTLSQFFKKMCFNQYFKTKQFLVTTLHDSLFWCKALKEVEGVYGTSVGCFFRFLRFLIAINSLISFIVFVFLFVPNIMFIEKFSKYSYSELKGNVSTGNYKSFKYLDWLTGAGWLADSSLYYGAYRGAILSPVHSNFSYDMSQAYFFTVTAAFVFYFVLFLHHIVSLYRVNHVNASDDGLFAHKIFCSWDFSMTCEKSAQVKKRSIYNELVEIVQEMQTTVTFETFCRTFWKHAARILVWTILMSSLAVLGFGVYSLLHEKVLHDIPQSDYFSRSMAVLIFPLIITLILLIIPPIIEGATRIEIYDNPRVKLYVSLIRVMLLGFVILSSTVTFWYKKSADFDDHFNAFTSEFFQSFIHEGRNLTTSCWESSLGAEVYRLLMVDFLLIIFSTLCIDSIKPFFVRRGNLSETWLNFSIVRSTLHIIYNQTLLWVGIFFAPLLSIFVTLKFVAVFYLQKFTVLRNSVPMERPWRAAQTETFFHFLTLLSLLLCSFSLGFILSRGRSSQICGPFRSFNYYAEFFAETFVVKTGLSDFSEKVFDFLLKPGFMFGVLVVLALLVYWLRNISKGRSDLSLILRQQLHVEMKDKVFLLRLIRRVQNGERVQYCKSPTPTRNNENVSFKNKSKCEATRRSSFIFSRSRLDDSVEAETSGL